MEILETETLRDITRGLRCDNRTNSCGCMGRPDSSDCFSSVITIGETRNPVDTFPHNRDLSLQRRSVTKWWLEGSRDNFHCCKAMILRFFQMKIRKKPPMLLNRPDVSFQFSEEELERIM
jgi:hypothetical protein